MSAKGTFRNMLTVEHRERAKRDKLGLFSLSADNTHVPHGGGGMYANAVDGKVAHQMFQFVVGVLSQNYDPIEWANMVFGDLPPAKPKPWVRIEAATAFVRPKLTDAAHQALAALESGLVIKRDLHGRKYYFYSADGHRANCPGTTKRVLETLQRLGYLTAEFKLVKAT